VRAPFGQRRHRRARGAVARPTDPLRIE
jgi:hypothetical protein